MAGPFDKFFGGGGGNMFGGNSLYADMLTPEQLAAVRQQSMMQVAAKLLESSGPSTTRRSLGQTLGGALSAGAEAMQSGQANAVQQMLLKQKLDEAKLQKDKAARIADIFGGGQGTTPLTAVGAINAPAGGAVGPTAARAAAIGTMPAGPSKADIAARYRQAANVSADDPVKAKAYMDIADQLAPREKFSTTPQFGRSAAGTPISYVLSEDGGMKVLDVQQNPDFSYQDMGGYISVRDKRNNQEVEQIKKTMSASEIASNQVARGNLGVAQGNLALSRDRFAREGQSGAGNATEGERKAATLLSRVSIAEQQIGEATKAAPGAAAPGLFNPLTPRVMQSEGRKQVEDAQDEFLDAALTLSTGAAYTKEQFDAARRTYFPAVNDDAQTIKDKENRRKNVIAAAKLAAGRAAGSVPAMPPSRFEQPAAAALPSGLGTGTFNVESYFAPQPR
jgi:hypothetical protein